MPHAPAPPLARTSAAISAVADLRPGASLVATRGSLVASGGSLVASGGSLVASGGSLVAMILVLLLRILARAEAAWFLPEEDDQYDEYEEDSAFDAYAVCGANPYALYPRPVGSAPHAIYVEAGLIADWILAGVRNRGMRALPMRTLHARHTLPVRAPPSPTPGLC
jgi:hypothetical protein